MTKYTIPQIAKALSAGGVAAVGAAITAAGGPDLSSLDLGEWALVLGTGLTAFGATFGTPNAKTAPSADTAPEDVTRAIEAIQASDDLAAAAAQRAQELKGALASAVTGIAADVFEHTLRNAGR